MYFQLSHVIGLSVEASDGPRGKVDDVCIEDTLWRVEHLAVADAGDLATHPASIARGKFGASEIGGRTLRVPLNHDEVAGGPGVSGDLPVSQHVSRRNDPRLGSVPEIRGYSVYGPDGEVGRLGDFIADDEDWQIQLHRIDAKATAR
jgi:sporulation protein YlmC with PRC-barrel domain